MSAATEALWISRGDIVVSTAHADLQEGSELLGDRQTVQHYSLQIGSGRCYDLVSALALLPCQSSPWGDTGPAAVLEKKSPMALTLLPHGNSQGDDTD